MASAIFPTDFDSVLPEISTVSDPAIESTAPTPTRSLPLDATGAATPKFLNQTIHLDQRKVNKQSRDDFPCTGVNYFPPEIKVDCVVRKRTTDLRWYYKFDVKISPTGLAYSQKGLDRWYDHFLALFRDEYDKAFSTFAVPRDPKPWQETWFLEEWLGNNWGAGMRVDSTEIDTERMENDMMVEVHLAAYLGKVIPKAVCSQNGGKSIEWEYEEGYLIQVVDGDEENDSDSDKDDDKGDEGKKGKNKDEDKEDKNKDHIPQAGGGYRGRGG